MRKYYRLYLAVCLTLLSFARTINSAILPSWDNKLAYHPDPLVFVHGMNSSPDAWGFQIHPETEEVTEYSKTSEKLLPYFDSYLKRNPDTKELLPYLEPFNYQYNTFDAVEWNSYEGYANNELQYPDDNISEPMRLNRPVLKKFTGEPFISPSSQGSGILSKYQTTKTNLVAHSLGGIVSRYYINKTQGANVKQLTTLGTPHKGTLSATLADIIVINPITDPSGQRRIWRIRFFSLFIKGIDVNRKPNMIDELKLSSQFIADLNRSIPLIDRYYCMGGIIRGESRTDGFIELESALASKERLPLTLDNYQPKSILPNYKGKILFPSWWDIIGLETNHLALPEKWEEILKAIDPAGRIEITEPKDGFSPPQEGEFIVEGKVYDEYLPADCKLELKVLLEGEMEERIIDNPNPVSGEPAWVWRLQPTDLWRADDPNSPVAEFEIRIPEEYANKTEKIKITVTNPAGYTSEDEVGWNLLIVDEGTKEVYCLDGPITIRANYPKVVNEFRLVDEEGNEIESRPLGVAWDDTLGIFYVSFDDKKIRAYNEYGELVKTNSGRGYMEVPEIPDGLVNPFNNGWGDYVSEMTSREGYFDYFKERVALAAEVTLRIPPDEPCDYWSCLREWSSVNVNPTDGTWEYDSFLWYSSEELGLVRSGLWVSKDVISSSWAYKVTGSIPLGFSPSGSVKRGEYFYFVSLDGRLYKKYCKSILGGVVIWKYGPDWQYEASRFYDKYRSALDSGYGNHKVRSFISHGISDLPEGFYSIKIPMLIQRSGRVGNVYLDVAEAGWNYGDISWSNQPNILYPLVHLEFPLYYSNIFSWDEVVVDVTEAVRERLVSGEETLDIRCSVDEEGEGRQVIVYLGPMYVEETTWAIDLPNEAPSDLGLGGKLKMRINPGYPASVNVGDIIQLEAHGKEPLVWQSSDEDVGKVDSNGLFTAMSKGTCTVTVTDKLGNMAVSDTISVQ